MLVGLVILFSACSWVFLTGVALGRPWLVVDMRLVMTSLAPACALAFFGLSVAASAEMCADGSGGDALPAGFAIWRTDHLPEDSLTSTTPGCLFGMLLVQSFMQLVPSEHNHNQLHATAVVCVHVLGAIFYLMQAFAAPCSLANRWHSGARTVPLHYALWVSSISSQLITLLHLCLVVERIGGRRAGGGGASAAAASEAAGTASATPRAPHRRCAVALLGVQAMVYFAVLGDAWHGDIRLSWLCMTLSFVGFYALLIFGILRPLADCREHTLAKDAASVKYTNALRYRRTTVYFLVVYHIFPLVWLGSNMGWLADPTVRRAYMVADILAKLVPPSLYISMIEASRR